MVKTSSSMLPLGTLAPSFKLLDVMSGETFGLVDHAGSVGTVVMFICNHCPYVKHVNPELVHVANDYLSKGIAFIAINSNDFGQYPDDSPEKMREIAKELGYPFPYLLDETQEVALAYQAKCTPDFFVFNKDLSLVYRGQLDDSRLGNQKPLNGHCLRMALNCLIDGRPITHEQLPSQGCSIKWKSS